jgi:lambda family phage tail tape measure protein
VSVVANVAINVDSRGAVSTLRQVQTQATATQRAFGALQSAIAGIGVASIAAQTLKAAASFNDLQTRLKLLTSEYGEYTQAQQFAAKAAKQFGLSNREAATGVADIYARLRPLGVSLKDIQSTFNGFNTIARLSGVSAAGASSAFLQLGQALGSGRLQGDEFRSIAEQIPGLLVAVSKETGIAAKDLKKFASDGKLSADIVINALKRIESEGAGKIAALVRNSDTQKFKDLQNAVDDLSVAVGNELLPVVTPLIKDLTSLVGTIAALPDPVKNATGEIVKLIIQLVLVEKAIKAIIGLNAAFVAAQVAMAGATASTGVAATTSAGAFALYANNARTLQATSVAATASVSGLAGALLGLAGIGIITVGINYVITQTGAIIGSSTAAGKSEAAGTAGGLAAQLKGKSAAERKQMLEAAQKNLANDEELASTLALQIQMQDNLASSASERALPSDRSKLTELQARINTNQARIKAIQTTPIERAKPTPKPTPTTATGAGTGAKKGNDDAKRAAEEKRRAAEELANLQGQVTLKEKLFGIDKQIAVEKQRGSLVTAAALEMDKALEERQSRIAEITRSTADTATKNAQIKDATLDADKKIYAVQQAIKEQEAERIKSFDAIIADLNLELALKTATTEQERERLRIEAARAKLQADLKGQGFEQPQIDQITGLQAQVAAPLTDVQKIDQHIGKLKDEIADLTSISNIAITSAEGIGNAFAQSFQGLISGSMTAKEALGSFFKSVADMFLEMAAQIIAKQMTMIILQTILKALGAVGGGGGGTVTGDFMNTEALKGFTPAANGATFANGIAKFASGGIVSSPTLFKFADGGTTRTGLMGEAGPEAIMPLKRGSDGSLGVQASGLREAMGAAPGSTGGGAPVLNMSFQSSTINGVEYVSRDQLEAAMAQTRRDASRDGAKRGMTMTLDKLQQSPSTRSRVGMR